MWIVDGDDYAGRKRRVMVRCGRGVRKVSIAVMRLLFELLDFFHFSESFFAKIPAYLTIHRFLVHTDWRIISSANPLKGTL